MEPVELDHEIEELEQRVERLRSLYEQYFLGIEKLEPLTARKDVDRRIWVLRREQIRNTRKRFRLQTIIQRYNTYQQYWMRINREIEAGTYRRHLIKAQKILESFNPLTHQARKRHRLLQAAAEDEAGGASRAERASELPDINLADADERLGVERDEAFARLDELFGPSVPPSSAPRSSRSAARRPRPLPTGGDLGTMDLDFDAVGGVLQASMAPERREPASDSPEPPTPRRVVAASPSVQAGVRVPAVAAAPPVPLPPPSPTRVGLPPPPPEPLPRPDVTARPRPGVPPSSGRSPPPGDGTPAWHASAPAAAGTPQVLNLPPVDLPPLAVPTPGTRIRSLQPPPKPHRQPQLAPGPTAAPPAARPEPQSAPLPRPVAAPGPLIRPAPGELTEERVRNIHSRLVEAKRQTADPNVPSVEGLKRSLEATKARLLQQHGSHRTVEFEVVIKDGKAVLKPVVR